MADRIEFASSATPIETLTSGDGTIDTQRDIFNDADKHRSGSAPHLSSIDNGGYFGSTYAINRFTKPFELDVGTSKQIHGGVNFHKSKKLDYVNIATEPFGDLILLESSPGTGLYMTASVNYLFITGSEVIGFRDCNDVLLPNQKKKYTFNVRNSREYNLGGGYDHGKGDLLCPFNLHSSSVATGYASEVSSSNFGNSLGGLVDFTNIHVDAYGHGKEVPMQGPFTEKFVGGRQHRHVAVNKYDSSLSNASKLQDQRTRTEAWYILLGNMLDGLGIVGPTYTTTGEYDKDVPRATRMRCEFAKRPINIRNIQQTTGSGIGNYETNWNVISTVGRTQNNAYFKDNGGVSLPSRHNTTLPATTHVHSLMGVGSHTGHATAVAAIDTAGAKASGADVSFRVTIPTANGGYGTQITILLDGSETTGGSGGSSLIAIGGNGLNDNQIAPLIVLAINGVADDRVEPATSGGGQTTTGIPGVTAALTAGSDTKITLTMDGPGTIGNLIGAIVSVSGLNIVKVTDFTGWRGNVFGFTGHGDVVSNRVATDTQFALPRRDLTGSNSVIVSRFSAPGGPEINSRGYLDIAAEEYSVHNALPYRNLSVRSSGSGEQGTIRMSIEGSTTITSARDREGLRTRLARHSGLHGYDSQYGKDNVWATKTDEVASYHKVNRNPIKRIKETIGN